MKFSTREDIEAPIDHVFARVCDFDAFEKRALRYGADVSRSSPGTVAVGTIWDLSFKLRGRDRKVQSTMVALDAPEMFRIESHSDGMVADTLVELVRLSPARTRLSIAIDLRPKTLTARLFIQSMKLAKTKLTKRFKGRVVDFAEDVTEQYRKAG